MPELTKYAWPGGYPVAYILGDSETLCHTCAREVLAEGTEWPLVPFVSWEECEYCESCEEHLETAYDCHCVKEVPKQERK